MSVDRRITVLETHNEMMKAVGFRRIRTEFQDLGVLYHEAPDAGRPAPPGVEFAEYRVDSSCVLRSSQLGMRA